MYDRKISAGKLIAILLTVLLTVYAGISVYNRLTMTRFTFVGRDLTGKYTFYEKFPQPHNVKDQRYVAIHDSTQEAYYIQIGNVPVFLYTKWHLENTQLVLEGTIDGESLSMLYGDMFFADDSKIVNNQVVAKLGNKDRRDLVKFTLPRRN